VDESLENFINLPNPPNFSHSKLLSFTVACNMYELNDYRDGTIQGTGVLMHHAKSITIAQYIIA